jgi:endonuclease G
MNNKNLLRFPILFLTFCAAFYSTAQQSYIDTVIHTGIYESYYSKKLKNPVFVKYYVYKGGGDCNRDGFSFKSTPFTAKNADYDKRYDKGHMANAEDFAFSCEKEKQTFWYYNCVPQTPNMNRGIWKKDETTIRELSQKSKMLVLCGSYFSNNYIGNKVFIPKYCWKVVQNSKTGEIVLCALYTNTTSAKRTNVSIAEMQKMTKVKLTSYLKKPYTDNRTLTQ